MDSSRRRFVLTLALAALGAGQATVSAAPPRGGRLTLKLSDASPGDSHVRGDGVRHDTPPDGFSFYVDRLITPPPVVDRCVTAKLESNGLGFIWLDNDLTNADCASVNGLTPRTFVLQLPPGACAAMGLSGVDACTLRMNPGTGEEPLSHPRIRLSTLYGSKAKTPVAFLFVHNGLSYEVRSDLDVPFSKTGDTWTLVNNPTSSGGRAFSLWLISGSAGKVASGFDLSFNLVATKK